MRDYLPLAIMNEVFTDDNNNNIKSESIEWNELKFKMPQNNFLTQYQTKSVLLLSLPTITIKRKHLNEQNRDKEAALIVLWKMQCKKPAT